MLSAGESHSNSKIIMRSVKNMLSISLWNQHIEITVAKDQRMGIRVSEEFKKKLETLAASERRSASSMIEIAVLEYIKRKEKKKN